MYTSPGQVEHGFKSYHRRKTPIFFPPRGHVSNSWESSQENISQNILKVRIGIESALSNSYTLERESS